MEEETPTPVPSVTKEKSSKVSDLINRFEGGRYVTEFELVCNSVCGLLELEPVRKKADAEGSAQTHPCLRI